MYGICCGNIEDFDMISDDDVIDCLKKDSGVTQVHFNSYINCVLNEYVQFGVV